MSQTLEKVLPVNITIPNVLDFIKAKDYINQLLTFDQDDAGKFFFLNKLEFLKDYENFIETYKKYYIPTSDYKTFPYLNYWHYLLDYHFLNVKNDTYSVSTVDFKQIHNYNLEKYSETNWRTYISEVWMKEYPETYTLWFSW